MEKSALRGKRILIIQQRSWGEHVGHFLATKLVAEGARLAAITYRKSSHDFHASRDVPYERLVNNDQILEDPESVLKGRRFSLEEITSALGIQSIWPLVAASRDISRSYGEGFYFHPRRQQMSDEAIVRYVQAVYASFTDLLDTFKPDALLTPIFSELSHLMLYHLCTMRGITPVSIVDSKVKGVWIASYSPWEDAGPFYDRVDALNAGVAESSNRERARRYIAEFRESFKVPEYVEKHLRGKPRTKRIREHLSPYRAIWDWYAKGRGSGNYVAPLGPTIDWRPPSILLRDHFTKLLWSRSARTFPYESLEEVGNYAYYPLQVEPEVTLDVFAPYFTDQKWLARQIAMSLPADYTLVVKDHPQMIGLRPPSYLEDLSRIPNIKLVDYRLPNEKVLRGASLVLSPNSTALVEAAYYGIPAIQFGNQGTPQKMPNVIRHTDMTKLPDVLAALLREGVLKGAAYEQKLENAVAAAYDTGYGFDYIAAWYEGSIVEREAVWSAYNSELLNIFSKRT